MGVELSGRQTIGLSDYRAVGLTGCRTIGPSDCRAVGVSGRRTIGLSEYRAVGLSGCRTIGLSDYRPWDYRAVGLSGRGTIGLSDYRAVGLSGRRTIGLSDYRAVGLSGCRTIGPSEYQAWIDRWTGKLGDETSHTGALRTKWVWYLIKLEIKSWTNNECSKYRLRLGFPLWYKLWYCTDNDDRCSKSWPNHSHADTKSAINNQNFQY